MLDRENLRELNQELQMMGKTLKDVQVADYMISGAVTSITVEVTNTNIGGGSIPVVGGIDIKKTEAKMTVDVRLIDIASTMVTATKSYEAHSGKTATSLGTGGVLGSVGIGGAFSSLKGTALEEVTRDIVIRSTADLIGFIQKNIATSVANSTKPSEHLKKEETE